ncbi:MAG: hypothetical protein KDD59_11470 [Bdellovibrionales bacterium]|nr:hypothetical protein [Bdellovibrionales bacterium]
MANSPYWIRFAIVVLLISPFLLIVGFVDHWRWPLWSEAGPVFYFTCLQAFLSAAGALLFGSLGGLGLLFLADRTWRRVFELFLILPSLVPTLFVLVSLMGVAQEVGLKLFGLWGIVVVHWVINVGLVAVAVSRMVDYKLGGMLELAWIEGATRLDLWRAGLWGYLRRDLALLFLFLFSVSFTSFAVPLILGGVKGTTMEVLIYNKMGMSGALGEALVLSTWQTVVLLAFGFLLSRQTQSLKSRKLRTDLIHWPWGILFPLSAVLVVVMGQLVASGDIGILLHSGFKNLWPDVAGTLAVGFLAGAFVFILLALVVYCLPHSRFQSFLVGYAAPSAAVTGFGLWLISGDDVGTSLLLIALGVAIVSLPVMYRYNVDSAFTPLLGQVRAARTLGGSWSMIFWKITRPQVSAAIGLAAGFTAFWATGDFALSSIIAPEELTVALRAKSLLASYRIEESAQLVWVILILGGALWGLFVTLGRVFSGVKG